MQDVGQSHTHNTVVTDTESWLTSRSEQSLRAKKECPQSLSKGRGTGSTRKSQAQGEERHDTDLCTHITCTHVHLKAIRGPKPKSGETDLWFSLFLIVTQEKLTSSRRIFQLLLFSASHYTGDFFFSKCVFLCPPTASPSHYPSHMH